MSRSSAVGFVLGGLLAVGGSTVVGAATTTTTPPAGPNPDNAHLFTAGDVVVPPGDPGVLGVVLSGPAENTSVPVIVRNNTEAAVVEVEVTGIARDAAGGLLATGSSQGFNPYTLQPGQWAIGYVYFELDAFAGGETFEFAVTSEPESELFGKIDLTVTEAVLQPGDYSDRVVGIVQNNTTIDSQGPNEVYVACFEGPNLTAVATGFTDTDSVPVGGIAPFTVDVYEDAPCASFAIASSGWDF